MLALLTTVILTGCGSIVTTSGSGPPPTVAEGPVVSLGFVGPLSGSEAPTGRAMQQGAYLAVQQFAADHPSWTVNLRSIDIAHPARAPEAVARLRRDRVVGVVGAATDAEAAVVDPLLEADGIPQIVVAATTDALAGHRGFHRLVADNTEAGAGAAAFLSQRNAASATVVTDGSAAPALLTSLLGSLAADPVTPTSLSLADAGETTGTVAAAVVASPPDWVVFAGQAATSGKLLAALHLAGYTSNVLLLGDAGDPARATAAGWIGDGSGLKAYLACGCQADVGSSNPDLAFVDAFRADTGHVPTEWTSQAFDAANVLLNATLPASSTASPNAAGPQPTGVPASDASGVAIVTAPGVERVLDAPGYSVTGLTGTISFTPQGELAGAPVWIYDVSGGKVTPESTPVIAHAPGT